MPSYTIYGDAASGYINSNGSTYAAARDGTGTINAGTTTHYVGQDRVGTTRYCYESFVGFDTSSIDDAETVTAVTATFIVGLNSSTTDFNVQLQEYNWGATLTTADWRTGGGAGQLAGLTDWATAISTSGLGASMVFTGNAAFISGVNKTGLTYFILSSSRHESGTAPSDGVPEFVLFYSPAESGTANDPVLDITTAGTFVPSAIVLL